MSLPFFAINPRGTLYVYTPEREINPDSGWTIISLILEPVENPAEKTIEKKESKQA